MNSREYSSIVSYDPEIKKTLKKIIKLKKKLVVMANPMNEK